MPGGTQSNGTGIGEFPSLVLGIAMWYRLRFGFGSVIGEFSSFLLGTACCALGTDIGEFALAVPFLLCPVWRPPPAGGNGAIKFLSISCRNNF